jgi:hypothetical protein
MNVEIANWERGRAVSFLGIFVRILVTVHLQCAQAQPRMKKDLATPLLTSQPSILRDLSPASTEPSNTWTGGAI